MNNDIEKLLKNLPVPELSRDFTQKVMTRLPELKKTKQSFLWQAVLAVLLITALVVVYANINTGAEKDILDFMILKAYLVIKTVFLLIKSVVFSKGMLVLYKVFLHMGKNLAHSPYFYSAVKIVLYEAILLLTVLLMWSQSIHKKQQIKRRA